MASYNLQKCVGLDMRRRPDRTLQVIDALEADIVILQEADKRLPPRPAALPHDLVESHGWSVLPFGQPGGSLGWHGNAMLARPHIRPQRTAHVDLPGLEPRGAILAEFDTPIGPLRVLGTHLGLIRRYRLMQLRTLQRHIRDLPDMPTVLAGDLNEWGPVSALDHTLPDLRILDGRNSFPAPRPVAELDRFALSDHLHHAALGAHRQSPARIASDHLPVWVDLRRAPTG